MYASSIAIGPRARSSHAYTAAMATTTTTTATTAATAIRGTVLREGLAAGVLIGANAGW
jgi:hypothetical protein